MHHVALDVEGGRGLHQLGPTTHSRTRPQAAGLAVAVFHFVLLSVKHCERWPLSERPTQGKLCLRALQAHFRKATSYASACHRSAYKTAVVPSAQTSRAHSSGSTPEQYIPELPGRQRRNTCSVACAVTRYMAPDTGSSFSLSAVPMLVVSPRGLPAQCQAVHTVHPAPLSSS